MAIRNYIGEWNVPQAADPLQQFTKAQQVRNLIQQGRQESQQIEINDQRLVQQRTAAEKAKRIEDDTRKFGEVYLSAKGNPDETIRMASEAGIDPGIIQGFQKHNADLVEKQAQTAAHELPAKKMRLEQAQGMLMQVESMPPEALVQSWPMLYQKALTLDPDAAKYLSPMQPPSPAQFAMLNAAVSTQGYQIAKAEEIRKNADDARKAAVEGRAAQQFAVEQPVRAAVAGATLADPAKLTPAQRSTVNVAEANTTAANTRHAQTLGEQRRHNLETELRLRIATNPDDKPLSVTEAQALGVPVGTTHKQAAGMVPTKAPTAAQNTIATYAARIKNAGADLDRLTPEYGLLARGRDAITPEILNTAVGKSYDRARRDIINAILRRESGAVISDSEFENAYAQYIPVAGDTADRIAEKKRNREIALGSYIKAAGAAYEDPEALVNRAQSGPGGGGQAGGGAKPVRKWNPATRKLE